MNQDQVQEYLRDLEKVKLAKFVNNLWNQRGFKTNVKKKGDELFVLYQPTETAESPATGILWILGDRSPTDEFRDRLQEIRDQIGVDDYNLVSTVDTTESSSNEPKCFTPERLAGRTVEIDFPLDAFPTTPAFANAQDMDSDSPSQSNDETGTEDDSPNRSKPQGSGLWSVAVSTDPVDEYWEGVTTITLPAEDSGNQRVDQVFTNTSAGHVQNVAWERTTK